jgi:hypothetical protein
LLGGSVHYSLLIPLSSWWGGDEFSLRLLLMLVPVFFFVNATKDVLCLPRPRGVDNLEIEYIEEYGFPSTHTAAAVVWAVALCEFLARYTFVGNTTVVVASGASYIFLVAFSRLYLGVHSIADILGGLQMGFFSVVVADGVLVPLAHTFALEEASKSYDLYFGSITISGPFFFSGLLGMLLCAYPDRRPGRTSYKDVSSIIGLAAGVSAIVGDRIRRKEAKPFGSGLLSGGSASAIGLLVVYGSAYAALGAVQVAADWGDKQAEKAFGFRGGIFRFIKYAAVGSAVAAISNKGACISPPTGWSVECRELLGF